MRQEEFALALNALLPGCDPEAPEKWAEFAAECVNRNEFAYFIPMEYDAAVEKWLDATLAGLWYVKEEYGPETAAKVAGLSCQRCAVYPGEMWGAADVLKIGGDAGRIRGMKSAGTLDTYHPFYFDLPDGMALTLQGLEISIAQSDVPYGLMERRMEPGYLLMDGAALLESERDDFGRYRGGAGMDGMYLQTGRLYAPVRDVDGQTRAFQEVKPVMAKEREIAFLSGQGDAFAIYRLRNTPPPGDRVSLVQLQKTGASPLDGSYDLIHAAQFVPGTDIHRTIESCRNIGMVRPGDIVASKIKGAVTCWYVDMLACSWLPGLLENSLKTAEIGAEQNYNQIDGIINNEAPRPSVRDSLKQFQQEASHSNGGDSADKSHRDPER